MNPMNLMRPVNQPAPFMSMEAPPPQPLPWFPQLLPLPLLSSSFWNTTNLDNRLRELHSTLDLAKTMEMELEMLAMVKEGEQSSKEGVENGGNGSETRNFLKFLEENKIDFPSQELLSMEAANAVISKLRFELEPFKIIMDSAAPWEEKSAAVRLADKMRKHKRNKLWRKRKRKRVVEALEKERERFDQADQEADEWRTREIAKDLAKRKIEKMKEIAMLKATEERRKLESELEMVLIVEKLQELRSIRIEKLKKQGHFLPEEDDKFLERVRAAVEEEERQALAAAYTHAAKDAIATAEESRKINNTRGPTSENPASSKNGEKESQNQIIKSETEGGTRPGVPKEAEDVATAGRAYESLASLPLEFYHYYHGSNTDMGTLIEVRRRWDAYIRPGGSRIPGHWVQPPPPADDIWASYLVKP